MWSDFVVTQSKSVDTNTCLKAAEFIYSSYALIVKSWFIYYVFVVASCHGQPLT